MSEIIIDCSNISKYYLDGNNKVKVLSNVNLKIYRGQQVAIMGRSGSGKTTLLQALGGLDDPSEGVVKIVGIDIKKCSESIKTRLRNQQIGFVYQLHHLIPEFTALENVCIPLLINQKSFNFAKQLGIELLSEVGLKNRLHFYPSQLSGGERQRVAIIRAIINNPSCILADEPTGNLDLESANMVIKVMRTFSKQYKTAIVMVTHDLNLASSFDRIYTLDNGNIQ